MRNVTIFYRRAVPDVAELSSDRREVSENRTTALDQPGTLILTSAEVRHAISGVESRLRARMRDLATGLL